jgi:dTDP-4-dehydrorhamnose 3,5-epimerase
VQTGGVKFRFLASESRRSRIVIFTETKLKGAFIIDLQRREDSRGYFARIFCQNEFNEQGLNPKITQVNVAFTRVKGTVRGMHFQFPPDAETKLVRCTRGAIWDVIVDLRPESVTYLHHLGVELTEENQRALYIPERFAHGYQTLTDKTDISYHAGAFYAPDSEGGLLHNDPRLGLVWPTPVTNFSERDGAFPFLDEVEGRLRQRMSVLR